MIIAWVLSLMLLLSSLVLHLERLAALELIGANAFGESQRQRIASENAILECEQQLSNIASVANGSCHIQSTGKNLWLISSKATPSVEVLVFLDEKTNIATRLNWRQNFEQ